MISSCTSGVAKRTWRKPMARKKFFAHHALYPAASSGAGVRIMDARCEQVVARIPEAGKLASGHRMSAHEAPAIAFCRQIAQLDCRSRRFTPPQSNTQRVPRQRDAACVANVIRRSHRGTAPRSPRRIPAGFASFRRLVDRAHTALACISSPSGQYPRRAPCGWY